MRIQTIALSSKKRLATSTPTLFRPNPYRVGRSQQRSFSTHGSWSSTRSFASRLWDKYTDALLSFPLLVKGGSASLIFFVSDSATQKLMNPESDWDGSRALSGAGFGVVATCWLHYWWGFLEVVVNKRLPVGAFGENRLINALGKVAADQLMGAPLYIYMYFCVTHFGKEWASISNTNETNQPIDRRKKTTETIPDRNRSPVSLMKETSDRALDLLPDTIKRHWVLWPAIHTLNFYYNPIHHRVLVQNIVLIFWSGYLSHLNNGGLDLMTPEQEVELASQKRQKFMLENEEKYITAILSS
jgi:hypothetical protein